MKQSALKEYVAIFEISGMTHSDIDFPEILKIDDNMIVKRLNTNNKIGLALIRFTLKENEESWDAVNKTFRDLSLSYKSKGYTEARNRLQNFVTLYSLSSEAVVNVCKEAMMEANPNSSKLEDFQPTLPIISLHLGEEDIEKHKRIEYKRLSEYCKYFRDYELKLNELYIRNAIHYLHHGICSDRLDEKIIAYFIGIESLVGEEVELTFRIATRTAILLSNKVRRVNDGSSVSSLDVFNELGRLYRMRSKIVHGKKTAITTKDVNNLKVSLRELVKVFFKLSDHMKREEILKLIDDSMIDTEHRKKLDKLINS